MLGYEHNLFVSYRRLDERWNQWTKENLVGALQSLLQPSIGRIKVAHDDQLETGVAWPQKLARDLARSQLMLAILSRDYFQSNWCRLELALMCHREKLLDLRSPRKPYGLVVPIIIDDGDSFPEEVQAMQALQLHNFANPFIRIDSPTQEALAELLKRKICPAIVDIFSKIPPFDPAWETIAQDQFDHAFKTKMQTQTTLPSFTFPPMP